MKSAKTDSASSKDPGASPELTPEQTQVTQLLLSNVGRRRERDETEADDAASLTNEGDSDSQQQQTTAPDERTQHEISELRQNNPTTAHGNSMDTTKEKKPTNLFVVEETARSWGETSSSSSALQLNLRRYEGNHSDVLFQRWGRYPYRLPWRSGPNVPRPNSEVIGGLLAEDQPVISISGTHSVQRQSLVGAPPTLSNKEAMRFQKEKGTKQELGTSTGSEKKGSSTTSVSKPSQTSKKNVVESTEKVAKPRLSESARLMDMDFGPKQGGRLSDIAARNDIGKRRTRQAPREVKVEEPDPDHQESSENGCRRNPKRSTRSHVSREPATSRPSRRTTKQVSLSNVGIVDTNVEIVDTNVEVVDTNVEFDDTNVEIVAVSPSHRNSPTREGSVIFVGFVPGFQLESTPTGEVDKEKSEGRESQSDVGDLETAAESWVGVPPEDAAKDVSLNNTGASKTSPHQFTSSPRTVTLVKGAQRISLAPDFTQKLLPFGTLVLGSSPQKQSSSSGLNSNANASSGARIDEAINSLLANANTDRTRIAPIVPIAPKPSKELTVRDAIKELVSANDGRRKRTGNGSLYDVSHKKNRSATSERINHQSYTNYPLTASTSGVGQTADGMDSQAPLLYRELVHDLGDDVQEEPTGKETPPPLLCPIRSTRQTPDVGPPVLERQQLTGPRNEHGDKRMMAKELVSIRLHGRSTQKTYTGSIIDQSMKEFAIQHMNPDKSLHGKAVSLAMSNAAGIIESSLQTLMEENVTMKEKMSGVRNYQTPIEKLVKQCLIDTIPEIVLSEPPTAPKLPELLMIGNASLILPDGASLDYNKWSSLDLHKWVALVLDNPAFMHNLIRKEQLNGQFIYDVAMTPDVRETLQIPFGLFSRVKYHASAVLNAFNTLKYNVEAKAFEIQKAMWREMPSN